MKSWDGGQREEEEETERYEEGSVDMMMMKGVGRAVNLIEVEIIRVCLSDSKTHSPILSTNHPISPGRNSQNSLRSKVPIRGFNSRPGVGTIHRGKK